MIFLVCSITCSIIVAVLLKLARRWQVDVRQAIAVNYVTAATLCVAILQPPVDELLRPATPWGVLIALGVLLPSVFLAMAASVRHAGIVRSDAAQRLSLFIPLLAAFLLFGEALSPQKLWGIAAAFAALACLIGRRQGDAAQGRDAGAAADTAPPAGTAAMPAGGPQAHVPAHAPAAKASAESPADIPAIGRAVWLWPLAVWLGYGVIDILFKQMARAGTSFAGGLLAAFVLAGVVAFGTLIALRVRWAWRHAAGGLLLGLANFGNILFYIRAHQQFPDNPALVFSAMNIGVIAAGTLVGAAAFREPLTLRNWLGVALAIVAIVIMIPRPAG